jgi:hypothetical protein
VPSAQESGLPESLMAERLVGREDVMSWMEDGLRPGITSSTNARTIPKLPDIFDIRTYDGYFSDFIGKELPIRKFKVT